MTERNDKIDWKAARSATIFVVSIVGGSIFFIASLLWNPAVLTAIAVLVFISFIWYGIYTNDKRTNFHRERGDRTDGQ